MEEKSIASSYFRSALTLYVEAVAIKTDFFDHPIEQVQSL